MNGYLCLVLHAHLPFVRHPERSEFLEEDWLHEAITETYLPILEICDELWHDNIDFRLTVSLSPTLVAMLVDPHHQERYRAKLISLVRLAEDESQRRDGPIRELAVYYRDLFRRRLAQFDKLGGDLVAHFRTYEERGRLELMTCAATHGFLPLMQDNPSAVRGQIGTAIAEHERHIGRRPRGIWLPECGYFHDLDSVLADHGINFFIGETHCIEHATPRPVYGIHAPIYTPRGVAAFARDRLSSSQVWSAEGGYPGHEAYREFYRDLGFDGEFEHLKEYVQPNGHRKNVGIKYHRVTGKTEHKDLYDPAYAKQIAADHATHFVRSRSEQVQQLQQRMGRPPVVVAPYDAELFGHWWFEGPDFLNVVLRQAACDYKELTPCTPSEYLESEPTQQVCTPHMSTWGEGGYASVWLNFDNDWIYYHLLGMAHDLTELIHQATTPYEQRVARQAARELLLAQASDWAFIMKNKTSVEYAVRRTKDHILRFNALAEMLRGTRPIDMQLLAQIETRDRIFPKLDLNAWKKDNAVL